MYRTKTYETLRRKHAMYIFLFHVPFWEISKTFDVAFQNS
jgi:hypothetical protein